MLHDHLPRTPGHYQLVWDTLQHGTGGFAFASRYGQVERELVMLVWTRIDNKYFMLGGNDPKFKAGTGEGGPNYPSLMLICNHLFSLPSTVCLANDRAHWQIIFHVPCMWTTFRNSGKRFRTIRLLIFFIDFPVPLYIISTDLVLYNSDPTNSFSYYVAYHKNGSIGLLGDREIVPSCSSYGCTRFTYLRVMIFMKFNHWIGFFYQFIQDTFEVFWFVNLIFDIKNIFNERKNKKQTMGGYISSFFCNFLAMPYATVQSIRSKVLLFILFYFYFICRRFLFFFGLDISKIICWCFAVNFYVKVTMFTSKTSTSLLFISLP